MSKPGTQTASGGAREDGDSPASATKVVVVMPARQVEQVSEIILVDDSSTDKTVRLAQELPVEVVWHPHQVGYGGNQKTCYLQALQRDADVVVMLHPDGQYEPG